MLLVWFGYCIYVVLISCHFLLEPSYTSRSSFFKFASTLFIVLKEHPSFSAISFRLMRLFSFTSSIIFSLILFWGSLWGSFRDSFFQKIRMNRNYYILLLISRIKLHKFFPINASIIFTKNIRKLSYQSISCFIITFLILRNILFW